MQGQHGVHGLGLIAAHIADFVMDRIQRDERIHALQQSCLPSFDLVDVLVGDRRDCRRRDVDAILLLDMTGDVGVAHL